MLRCDDVDSGAEYGVESILIDRRKERGLHLILLIFEFDLCESDLTLPGVELSEVVGFHYLKRSRT